MKNTVLISLVSIFIVIFIVGVAFFLSVDIVEMLTGRTISRANIIETVYENCSVNLYRGINYVSFPCETGMGNISVALSDINGTPLDFEYLFFYNPLVPDDPWLSFNPSLPNWTLQANIETLNRRLGYAIYMNENNAYFREGVRFSNTIINLKKGWNLVSYPSVSVASVEVVLSSISDYFLKAYSYQLVNGSMVWLSYEKNVGGDLEFFLPGYAYWLFLSDDASWVVSW